MQMDDNNNINYYNVLFESKPLGLTLNPYDKEKQIGAVVTVNHNVNDQIISPLSRIISINNNPCKNYQFEHIKNMCRNATLPITIKFFVPQALSQPFSPLMSEPHLPLQFLIAQQQQNQFEQRLQFELQKQEQQLEKKFKLALNNNNNNNNNNTQSLWDSSYESNVDSDDYCLPSNKNRKRKIKRNTKSKHFQGAPRRKRRRQNNSYEFQMASMMMNICEKLIDRSTITVENGGINTKIESGGIYNNIEAGGIYNKIDIASGGINNYYHIENYNGLINNCMLKGDDNNEVLNGLNNFDNNKKDVKLNNNNNNASNDDCNDGKYFYQNLNGQKSLQNSEKDKEYKIILIDETNNDKKSVNKNIRYGNKLKTLTGKHVGAINDEK